MNNKFNQNCYPVIKNEIIKILIISDYLFKLNCNSIDMIYVNYDNNFENIIQYCFIYRTMIADCLSISCTHIIIYLLFKLII